MTSYPHPLAARLRALGLNVRPITWPTVPKGKERVRICLHAENTLEQVDLLIRYLMQWATQMAIQSPPGGVLAKL
jgi:8-amino-7-oxononanoate synthase